MAKKKKAVKAKEPIRLRFKELANGNKSIYLDIYRNGKRSYEFLKLYLIPEVDEATKARNVNTLQAANAIKAQKIIELTNDEAGVTKASTRSKMEEGRIMAAGELSTRTARFPSIRWAAVVSGRSLNLNLGSGLYHLFR